MPEQQRRTPIAPRRAHLGRLAWVLTAALLVLGVSACGSSNVSSSQSYIATGTNVVPYPPVPTAQQLDTKLVGLALGDVPDDERLSVIEDGEAFRPYLPDFANARRDHPYARFSVVDPVLDNHDGTITATVRFDKDGDGRDVKTTVIHFKAIDGQWKIARPDVCGILLNNAKFHTTVCG